MKILNKRYLKLSTALITVVALGSAFVANNDKYFEIAKNMEIFTNVYKQLNTHYVDDLEPNQLMRTGIDAMMNSLDPYTVYYSESQVESYRISTDNKYNGLGAASKEIDNKIVITEIYDEGPAQEAGLKVGQHITSINGNSTEGKTYEEVMLFMRGLPGTKVNLSTYDPASGESNSVVLTRSEVSIPNVPYYGMVSDEVGYINLTTFTRDAGKNIGKAIRELKNENELNGIILDLRNNGGGLLAEAIDILGLFLPQGTPVVSTRGKVRDRDQNYSTRRLPIDLELPVVVLVNKNSASASEIVSGSIQDMDRGVVMGQRTYGKGLVQNHQEVGYNSRIKVTTSKYYIPSGRCIQSVAYENGEPKDIPDDEREVFYTRNRRPVLDGGGVTPDVALDPAEKSDIVNTLIKEDWIFKYANEYVDKNEAPASYEEFAYDDYDGFLSYLKKNNFSYKTKEEKALDKLNESIEDSELDISASIDNIESTIAAAKADDLTQYQRDIIDQIEAELAKRYFLQEGKTRQMLKNDEEVDQAIALLNNPSEYQSILR